MQPAIRIAVDAYLRRQRARTQHALAETTAEPERYQRETLLGILAANSGTTYRREHDFARLRSVADFQSAVPVNTYEELRPYVDRIAEGSDPHALTADPVEMFTNTSGTTSKPKLVPVTAGGRRAERRVKTAWLAHLAGDHPSILSGQAF